MQYSVDRGADQEKPEADDRHAPASMGSTTRRDLLKTGAGLVAAVSGAAPAVAAPAVAQPAINLPRAPNLIVLMTDQERHHMHWPRAGRRPTCRVCSASSGTVFTSTALTRRLRNARRRAR